MSQRILIHIHGRSVQNNQPRACYLTPTPADTTEGRARRGVFVTHQNSAPRGDSYHMRNKLSSSTEDESETTNSGLNVQVQIEQAVMVDNYPVMVERTIGNRE